MKETRDGFTDAQGAVDRTQQSLRELASAPGEQLQPTYEKFTAAVEDLQDTASRAGKQSADMQKHGKQYLESWEKEMAQVQSAELRSSATQRQAAVRVNYTKIKGQLASLTAQVDSVYAGLSGQPASGGPAPASGTAAPAQ